MLGVIKRLLELTAFKHSTKEYNISHNTLEQADCRQELHSTGESSVLATDHLC